jgi:psp operon transcriptional activator
MLTSALARSRYNQRRAAALLGVSYDQFRSLYRRFQTPAGDGESRGSS